MICVCAFLDGGLIDINKRKCDLWPLNFQSWKLGTQGGGAGGNGKVGLVYVVYAR